MNIITTPEDVKDGSKLTVDELRLLQIYRHFDAHYTDYMLRFAENFAASYEPKKPALRIVKGGAV